MAINPLKVWAYNGGQDATTYPTVYDGAYRRYWYGEPVAAQLGFKQLFYSEPKGNKPGKFGQGTLESVLKLFSQDVRQVGGRNGLRVILNQPDCIPEHWPRRTTTHPDLGLWAVEWTPALEDEFFTAMQLLYDVLIRQEIDAGRRPLLDWIDLCIADGLLNEANHFGTIVQDAGGWPEIVARQKRFITRSVGIFGTRCVMNIGGHGPGYALEAIQHAYDEGIIAWRQDNFGHEKIDTLYHRLELCGAVWEKTLTDGSGDTWIDTGRNYDPNLSHLYVKIDHWLPDKGKFIFMEVTDGGVHEWPSRQPPLSFETMFGPGGEAERIWVNAVGDMGNTLNGQTPSYEPTVDDRLAEFYALHDGDEIIVDPPELQVTPNPLDFGDAFLGTSKDLTLLCENIGPSGFLTLTVPPEASTNFFTVIEGAETVVLHPGQTHQVKIRFLTLAAGAAAGTIEITTAIHNNVTVDLAGTGVEEPVEPPIYDYRCRLLAEITTFNGTFTRVSDSVTIPSREVVISGGVLSYPDVRCTEMRLYVQDKLGGDPDKWLEHSRYECTGSQSNNFAFSVLDTTKAYIVDGNKIDLGVIPSNPREITQAQIDAWNGELDHDANRLVYSETSKPRLFRAKSVVYAGDGANDRVMGFGANAQPISLGQFGTHPLYIVNRHSITPMSVLSSGGFAPGEPISTSIGAIGRYAIANAAKAVVFVSDEGVYSLTPQLQKISESLEAYYGGYPEVFEDGREPDWASDSLQNQLSSDVALGYFTNRDLNVNEVWVGTAAGVYAYSLKHNRWFTMKDRTRMQFLSTYFEPTEGFEPPRFLYSVDEAAGLYEESQRVTANGDFNLDPYAASSFEIETSKLTLGEAGYKQRVRRMGIRQRNMVDLLNWVLLEPLSTADCYIDPECADPPEDLSSIEIRSGLLTRGVDPDVWNTGHLKVLSPILRLWGSGSPHQAIESFLFVVRTLYPERRRIDNYQDIGTF